MLFSSETTLKNLPILAVLAEGFLQTKFYNINYFWSLRKRGKEKSFYYFFGKLRTRQLFDKTSFENRTSQSTKKNVFSRIDPTIFFAVGPQQLSGFVCNYNRAVLGSNSMHTIYTFAIYSQVLYNICHCNKKRTKQTKRSQAWPMSFKKNLPAILINLIIT